MRFSLPKMKYKGKTIQFQRVRAKKGPKIQDIGGSSQEISEEERKKMEAKGLEQMKGSSKVKEVVENTPQWQLYCVLKQVDPEKKEYVSRFSSEEFWT